jgi:hypothetical protein
LAKSRLVWDSRIQTELRNRSNKRVEEAISRAAKLEKEAADARGRVADIERITAWRHISEEQRVEIAVSIEHMAGDIDLLIEYEMSNGEAFTYAREIAGIFVSAGVSKIRHSPNSYIGTGFFGVSISATFPPINLSFVTNVFSKAGVKAWSSQRDLSKHLLRNVRAPNLYIFVAPKPPPEFMESSDGAAAPASADEPAISLGKAISEANEAGLQTERIRKELAGRRVSEIEFQKISEYLASMEKYEVRVIYESNDPEASTFAHDIGDVFKRSGWAVLFMSTATSRKVVGLVIPMYPGLKEAREIAGTAFIRAAIPFSPGTAPPVVGTFMNEGDDISGPCVDIHVGSKPGPMLA